jgi:hypothetical protein
MSRLAPNQLPPSRQGRTLPASDDLEDIVFTEQHATAGRSVIADLASHQPSIDCPYVDTAQASDFTFGQQLLGARIFRRRHLRFLPVLLILQDTEPSVHRAMRPVHEA